MIREFVLVITMRTEDKNHECLWYYLALLLSIICIVSV